MPHVRIRPNGATGQRALRVFELDFQSERVNVFGPFLELVGHLDGEHSAVQQPVKRCLGEVVAKRYPWTGARLTDQLTNGMQKLT